MEVILVENFSNDRSGEICRKLAEEDRRVLALTCREPGTTFARKKGIEAATGKYIFVMDQDDRLLGKNALRQMCAAIEEDGVQICQFGIYKQYFPGLRRHARGVREKKILERSEFLKTEIAGVLGGGRYLLNVNFFTKLYDAAVLKSAVGKMELSLYMCDDMFINALAFLDAHTLRVSIRPDAYYLYSVGVGTTSGEDFGEKLFQEYDRMKPVVAGYARESGVPEKTLFQFHLESVYFYKTTVDSLLRRKKTRQEIYSFIEKTEEYRFIRDAKEYFRRSEEAMAREDLRFLSSDYTPQEYCDYCAARLPKIPLRQKIRKPISILYRKLFR